MYIQKIEIENIRSIRHFEMSFAEPAGWHVLIGDNGAGKSSILKAISLAIIGTTEASSLRLKLNEYIHNEASEGSIELIFGHDLKHKAFKTDIKLIRDKNHRIETAKIEQLSAVKYAGFSCAYGPFRRFTGGNKEWDRVYSSNPRAAAHLSIFGEDVALTESIDWLVDLNYKKLEKDEDAAQLLNNIERFINEGGLLPHDAKIVDISSKGVLIQDGYGQKVAITEMSDGFRSVLSMTFDILRQLVFVYGTHELFEQNQQGEVIINSSGIVLIDEVDVHLHPTWQTRIGQWFTHYFPNIQFIVTTHSPLVCRSSEKGSIWRLAAPHSKTEQGEITGIEKEKLIKGNILDAYGTEAFGKEPVRSSSSDEEKEKLGELNMLFALGTISKAQDKERKQLQKILNTDDPTGF